MTRMVSIVIAGATALCALYAPARAAEDIISGVSTDLIQIQSDFTGTDVVIFGALEGTDPATTVNDYDVVVVLRGPEQDMTVRRKERVLGIWINREQINFADVPGYYFLATTRPIEAIAPEFLLNRFQLGADILGHSTDRPAGDPEVDTFREAAFRNLEREQLFTQAPDGIEFLSPTLFRAVIPVPATVPPGEYNAEVYLFRAGTLLTLQSTPVFVDKTGLERRIYDFAYTASLTYGFFAVGISFFLGWLSFALFRPR
jgi:uncharacterized protein (TIGR02186 family)